MGRLEASRPLTTSSPLALFSDSAVTESDLTRALGVGLIWLYMRWEFIFPRVSDLRARAIELRVTYVNS